MDMNDDLVTGITVRESTEGSEV